MPPCTSTANGRALVVDGMASGSKNVRVTLGAASTSASAALPSRRKSERTPSRLTTSGSEIGSVNPASSPGDLQNTSEAVANVAGVGAILPKWHCKPTGAKPRPCTCNETGRLRKGKPAGVTEMRVGGTLAS